MTVGSVAATLSVLVACWALVYGVCALVVSSGVRTREYVATRLVRSGVNGYEAARIVGGTVLVDRLVLLRLHALGRVHVSREGVVTPVATRETRPSGDPLVRAAALFPLSRLLPDEGYKPYELGEHAPYAAVRDTHVRLLYDLRANDAPPSRQAAEAAIWMASFMMGGCLLTVPGAAALNAHSVHPALRVAWVVPFLPAPWLLARFALASLPAANDASELVDHCCRRLERDRAGLDRDVEAILTSHSYRPVVSVPPNGEGCGGGCGDIDYD
ncbi:hypothetical protein [Embleya hyalina]|uniref:Uncharacterized protein n=1 Tax=Embleya hyalina TaxID=516124 RepID=A0A401YMM5_9ACTN|nr:hypothetical protein [Embleya hyalina]GCD95864.1 hypothetical protein EHYA_03548 [Embleya hyalina]